MDFESFGNLSNQQINDIAIAFINTDRELSKKEVIVYSDTYNATNTYNGEITNYPLWVAEYGVNEPLSNGNWNTWTGFQYTDTGTVRGIDGYVVNIEIDTIYGKPSVSIVGMGDTAIKEARERLEAAIINSKFEFPKMKIVINYHQVM